MYKYTYIRIGLTTSTKRSEGVRPPPFWPTPAPVSANSHTKPNPNPNPNRNRNRNRNPNFNRNPNPVYLQVPPTTSTKRNEGSRMAVTELPDFAQLAFGGVSSLNQLQSAVVSTALHSHENMLVCAPTGAGKTNVALLAICEQVILHSRAGRGIPKMPVD